MSAHKRIKEAKRGLIRLLNEACPFWCYQENGKYIDGYYTDWEDGEVAILPNGKKNPNADLEHMCRMSVKENPLDCCFVVRTSLVLAGKVMGEHTYMSEMESLVNRDGESLTVLDFLLEIEEASGIEDCPHNPNEN